MAAFGKPHELFRLIGEGKQLLAKAQGNDGILCTVHDKNGSGDARYALVGPKRIPRQPARRHDSENRRRDVGDRRIGRFQDDLADGMIGRHCDSHTAAQRKAPDHNAIGRVSPRGEGIGRRGIREQSLLARLSTGAGITAIRQGNEPGAIRGDRSQPWYEPGQIISVAVKIEYDLAPRSCRHMPDDDALAIGRGQNVLFSLGKARRVGRGAQLLRNRKDV